MTNVRYDGALLAPAARLRGHGTLRRALQRMIATREANAGRAVNFHALMLDDASLATYGSDRGDFERAGQSCYPF